MALLSIVLPAYNEEQNIANTTAVLTGVLEENKIEYELIFISDGSVDGTFDAIQREAEKNPRIKGAEFSRNFGKEAGIFAGLELTTGDAVIVMDCDLQHPPAVIPKMWKMWQDGVEVVEGIKTSRGRESLGHKLSAGLFYKVMSSLIKMDMSASSDFKLLDRRAVDTLLAMREKNAFFRALSSWIGFSTTQVEFEVQPRLEGESKWSIRSLVRYALTNIAAFSAAPLQLVTLLGVVVFICSVVLGIWSLWQKVSGQALEGFTTVILLQLLIGSILMICLGIIGYYIAKIYEEVKDRPRYIVAERCEGPKNDGQAEKDI